MKVVGLVGAGIIGAGGAGFPTYIKYKDSQPYLIINATEREPSYQADKVMHKEYFDEFLSVYEALNSSPSTARRWARRSTRCR